MNDFASFFALKYFNYGLMLPLLAAPLILTIYNKKLDKPFAATVLKFSVAYIISLFIISFLIIPLVIPFIYNY